MTGNNIQPSSNAEQGRQKDSSEFCHPGQSHGAVVSTLSGTLWSPKENAPVLENECL